MHALAYCDACMVSWYASWHELMPRGIMAYGMRMSDAKAAKVCVVLRVPGHMPVDHPVHVVWSCRQFGRYT